MECDVKQGLKNTVWTGAVALEGIPVKYPSASPNPVNRKRKTSYHLCNDCGKVFTSRWGLKLHEPVHTGRWKYMCSLCDRGFMETKKFNAHVLGHKRKIVQHNLI